MSWYRMENLIFDYKKGVGRNLPPPINTPAGRYEAVLHGGDFVVKEPQQANELYSYGTFGSFLGHRNNIINRSCFRQEKRKADTTIPSEEASFSSEPLQLATAKEPSWLDLISKNSYLFLGPEETLYLSHELQVLSVPNMTSDELWTRFVNSHGMGFVKRYAVYRYFRQNGWVVRGGLSFGVDYLLYKDGPDYTHSSVGVHICDDMKEPFTTARMRGLGNCKKALVVVGLNIAKGLNTSTMRCLRSIHIKPLIMTRWNPNKSRIADLGIKLEGTQVDEVETQEED